MYNLTQNVQLQNSSRIGLCHTAEKDNLCKFSVSNCVVLDSLQDAIQGEAPEHLQDEEGWMLGVQ